MTDILVTNDDGYTSAGFVPLVKHLSQKYDVCAVVPDRGRSWIGKAITTKKELKLRTIQYGGVEMNLLNGTPADCVQIGLYDVASTRPKLVISGINIGLNIGTARILSSGTIGAAMEASIDGVQALAVSLSVPMNIRETNPNFYHPVCYPYFENPSKITEKVGDILIHEYFEGVDLFSLNIPFDATLKTPLEITIPYRTKYGRLFHKKGNRYHQKTPPVEFKDMGERTDLKAISDGRISLTPMNLSLVAQQGSLQQVEHIFHQKW
jgi:5'-nucleotidase